MVCRPPGPGHGTVEEYDTVLSGWEITVGWGSFSIMTLIMTIFIVLPQIEGVTLLLGGWWLEAAKRGGPDTLPVINLSPEVKRERALSLSLELLFIHTSFCLMSDYLMYVLSSLLHMSAELMVTRGTKAWKLCYKVFFFWKWSKKGFIRNVRRIQLCENDSISNSLKRQKMKIQDIFIQSDRLFSFQELKKDYFVCSVES